MAEEMVEVTLRKNHGARVTLWGYCAPGKKITVPRSAADAMSPYVWDVPGKTASKTSTKTESKSGGKATAKGKE